MSFIGTIWTGIHAFYLYPFSKWEEYSRLSHGGTQFCLTSVPGTGQLQLCQSYSQRTFSIGDKVSLTELGVLLYGGTLAVIALIIYGIYGGIKQYLDGTRCQHCKQWDVKPVSEDAGEVPPARLECDPDRPCCTKCYDSHPLDPTDQIMKCAYDGNDMEWMRSVSRGVLVAVCLNCGPNVDQIQARNLQNETGFAPVY